MSFDLKKFLTENKLTVNSKNLSEAVMLNGKEVNLGSIEMDGIDRSDYPDFADAFITYAEFVDGTPLTDDEMYQLDMDGVGYEVIFDNQLWLETTEKSPSYPKPDVKPDTAPKEDPRRRITPKPGVRPNPKAALKESFEQAATLPEEGQDYSKYLNFESAEEVIKEIESEVSKTTMEAKMSKIKEVIAALEAKANSLEEDSNLKGFVNTGRLKEMRRMTKKLRMTEEKYIKEYEKKFSKNSKHKKD